MKHLKPFDSDRQIANIAKEQLDDVLVYLKDDGYIAEVEVVMDYHAHIFLRLFDYQNKKEPLWKEIKDDIERCIEVIKDTFEPMTVYFKVIQPNGKIINKNNRDVTNWDSFKNYITDDTKLIYFSLVFNQVLPNGSSFY